MNPGIYVTRDGDVKWSGQQMRFYDLSNGAHVVGLPIDSGTHVSGFKLHVLDVPTGQQRGGVGEDAVRWLKRSYGAVDIIDPLPDVLGFWKEMKKRGLVRSIEYSEGEPGDNPPSPVTMPELYHLDAELHAIEETDRPNDLLWVALRGKIEDAAKRPVDTDATAKFFDAMLIRFNAIVKKRSSAHTAAQATTPIGAREWNELVNLRMQAFDSTALHKAGSKFKKLFKSWSGRPWDAALVAGFKGGTAAMDEYVDHVLGELAAVGVVITARKTNDNPPQRLVREAERIIRKLEAGR